MLLQIMHVIYNDWYIVLNQILANDLLDNDLLRLHVVEVNLAQKPSIEEEAIDWEESGTPQFWVEAVVEEEVEEVEAISNST